MTDGEPTEQTEPAYRLVGSRCYVRASTGEWEPAGPRDRDKQSPVRSDGPVARGEEGGGDRPRHPIRW